MPAPCPVCGIPTAIVNQYETRHVQDLSISGKEVWLHLRVPQLACTSCPRYFSAPPNWLLPGKTYTRRQAKWIFELCAKQPFTEVAATEVAATEVAATEVAATEVAATEVAATEVAATEVAALVNLSHKTARERLYYRMAEEQMNLPDRYARVRKLGIDSSASTARHRQLGIDSSASCRSARRRR